MFKDAFEINLIEFHTMFLTLIRKGLALLLLLLLVTQSFQYGIEFVCFKAQQDFIAKTLCVQKNIEDNECEGHCQLEKKLEQTIQQQMPLDNKENNIVISFNIKIYTFNTTAYHLDFSTVENIYNKTILQTSRCTELKGFEKDMIKPPIA